VSDDILSAETEMDELDNGFGATVTILTPLNVFQKKKSVHVTFNTAGGDVIGAFYIDAPPLSESTGKFHDQGDAKWIVIMGQLRRHNDKPFGRPTPGRPIGRTGVFGVF
jgi:hypothetical protein